VSAGDQHPDRAVHYSQFGEAADPTALLGGRHVRQVAVQRDRAAWAGDPLEVRGEVNERARVTRVQHHGAAPLGDGSRA
jgi:hypothetical protein